MPRNQSDNALTALPNIGQAFTNKLNRIGIHTADEFLARDPYDVYTELLEKVDPSLCRCALATLIGAKQGKPWNTVHKQAAKEYQKRHPDHHWHSRC